MDTDVTRDELKQKIIAELQGAFRNGTRRSSDGSFRPQLRPEDCADIVDTAFGVLVESGLGIYEVQAQDDAGPN